MSERVLIWVSVPHFTCGLEVVAGRVAVAAPIMRWAIGKDAAYVERWVRGKRGVWKALPAA